MHKDDEREFRKLVRKLLRITVELEEIGETDMGLIRYGLAKRFHRATNSIRALTVELTQDVAWPHEPGIPARVDS